MTADQIDACVERIVALAEQAADAVVRPSAAVLAARPVHPRDDETSDEITFGMWRAAIRQGVQEFGA